MSKNRAERSSQNYKTTRSSSRGNKSKKQSNFKPRDKPKYKSGAKPNNRSRDRGEVRSRKRPSSRSKSKPNYRSDRSSPNKYDDKNKRHSNRGSKELHSTICSECKKETKVPFKPTGVKPVYCRECYQKHKPHEGFKNLQGPSSRSGGRSNYRSSDKPSKRYADRNRTDGRSKQFHTTICSKCKKETQVPFIPTGAKPVYCRECFQNQKEEKEITPTEKKKQIRSKEVIERFGDTQGPYRVNKRMHLTICRKCEKELMIPFKPKPNKPIYCQDCFQKESKNKEIQK
jgi:CxxC-x17-CxxC domain-containing protein